MKCKGFQDPGEGTRGEVLVRLSLTFVERSTEIMS